MTTVSRTRALLASVVARGRPRCKSACSPVAPRVPNSPPSGLRSTRSPWAQRRWNSDYGFPPPQPTAYELREWYKALGVGPRATHTQIQRAWLAKVRVLNTDHDQSRDRAYIQSVNVARDELRTMDATLRARLDAVILEEDRDAKQRNPQPKPRSGSLHPDHLRKKWENMDAAAAAREEQQEKLRKAAMANKKKDPKRDQPKNRPTNRKDQPSRGSQAGQKASSDDLRDAQTRSRPDPQASKKHQFDATQTSDSTGRDESGTSGKGKPTESQGDTLEPGVAKPSDRAKMAAQVNPRVVRISGLPRGSVKEFCKGWLELFKPGPLADVRFGPKKQWDVEFYTAVAARRVQSEIAWGNRLVSTALVDSTLAAPPKNRFTSRCLTVEDPEFELSAGGKLLDWGQVQRICRKHGVLCKPLHEHPGHTQVELEFASWRREARQVKASIEQEKLPGVRVIYASDPCQSKFEAFLDSSTGKFSDGEEPSLVWKMWRRIYVPFLTRSKDVRRFFEILSGVYLAFYLHHKFM